ncbi:MAG: hypothetical protein N3E52_04180 [Candidatus Bathyarchaeota archaeon]|nr:hypothetical protein [Candidatus Bathyarchaeota archaeon]
MRKQNNKATVAKLHNPQECSMGLSPTMTQLKLSIAMELRSEGYSKVFFDKVIEAFGRKARVHVLAEDELGCSLAVICMNKPGELDLGGLSDAVEVVQRSLGEDGEVAIAIPVGLLGKARKIFGITRKVFLVDEELRVWTHLCDRAYTGMIKHVMLSQRQNGALDDKEDLPSSCEWQNLDYVV